MYNEDELLKRNAVIGEKIRFFRRACGITQHEAANKLGVSYQQFQKYETAQNRISAASLELFAEMLQIPVEHFFSKNAEPKQHADIGAMRLVRSYQHIRNRDLQQHLLTTAELYAGLSSRPFPRKISPRG